MANPITRTPNAGIIDRVATAFGRKATSPTTTTGAPGFRIYGGYIQTDETNAKLEGDARYRTYSDMLANVSIVAAGTRYFANLVSKAGWIFEAAEDESFSDADKDRATELAEIIKKMTNEMQTPWARVIRRLSLYKFYGFAISEWTATRRDDGTIGMLDVASRPQHTIERWEVDRVGTVQSVIQRNPQTDEEVQIPRGKLVYGLDDTLSDSPEGLGLLRHLVEPAERLQRYQLLEAFAFDTELRGIPVIYAPLAEINEDDQMSVEQKAASTSFIETFLQKHQRNPEMGLFFDSSVYRGEDDAASPGSMRKWQLDLVQGDGSGMAEVAVAIERINREMARIMGVEGLLLGGEKVGSMALSQDKSQNFALIVDSTLSELQEVVKRDWVRPIFILNGWDEKFMPTPKTDQTQYRDIEQITRALADMASAGSTLAVDDPAIDSIRDLLGLPRPPEINEEEAAAIRNMSMGLTVDREGNVVPIGTPFNTDGSTDADPGGDPGMSNDADPDDEEDIDPKDVDPDDEG